MRINMNLTETEQFKQMIEQHNEMFDMVKELREAVVGNPEYQRKGVIEELKELRKVFTEHDKLDEEKFDKIFEYQKKQQYFVGASSIVIKCLWAVALIAAGHFIPKLFM